jgi:hypothetical protein
VGRDRDALGWFAEALCLAPHGDLVPMVRQWLDDSDPAYRAVAVRVLTSRGALSVEERTRCARDRPEIAALVVTDMALAGDDAVDEVIERLLERKAPPREAWIALAVRRRGHAVQRLRAQQRWDWLALLGTRGDAEEISRAALRDPTAESLASVGCAGLVTSVEPLIELTRHEDEAIAIAAARALWRMTAAPLIGVVHIAPEIAFAPDLPDPPTGGLASPMPRSASPDEVRGSDDMVSLPLPDHGAWSAWWRAHRDGFDQNLRHRAGKPWSLAVAHDELARSGELDVRERSQLAAELTMIGGVGVGFDISALVVDQLDALTRWHAALAGIGPRPGAWPG